MIDVESFDLRLERKLERYQRRYRIPYSDLAWILLRMGTNYYFKDICSRGLIASGQRLDRDGHALEIQQVRKEEAALNYY